MTPTISISSPHYRNNFQQSSYESNYLKPGKFTIIISALRYRTCKFETIVFPNQKKNIEVTLTPLKESESKYRIKCKKNLMFILVL